MAVLVFRILLSLELIIVHGLKKIGVGIPVAETIPNPFHLPTELNNYMAIAANLFFPVLVAFGFFTRIAVLPILAVTLSGYFVVHAHDSLLVRDIPFMYSLGFVFLFLTGPGKYSIDHLIFKKVKL